MAGIWRLRSSRLAFVLLLLTLLASCGDTEEISDEARLRGEFIQAFADALALENLMTSLSPSMPTKTLVEDGKEPREVSGGLWTAITKLA